MLLVCPTLTTEHSHELGNWAVVDDEDVVGAAGGPGGLMLQVRAGALGARLQLMFKTFG